LKHAVDLTITMNMNRAVIFSVINIMAKYLQAYDVILLILKTWRVKNQ